MGERGNDVFGALRRLSQKEKVESVEMLGRTVISNPRRFFGEIRLKDDDTCPTLNSTDYKDPPLAIEVRLLKENTRTLSVMPINTAFDGTARTIKAQYYKISQANMMKASGQAATGVAVVRTIRREK